MKMAKKLLCVVLTVCMVLTLLPVTALADAPNYLVIHPESAAVPCTTLAEAVAIAADGDTIQAQGDVNEDLEPNATITIDKNLAFDLGGHSVSLSAPNCTVLSISDGCSLTVKNGILIAGTSGLLPSISVDGGSLTLSEEDPAEIYIASRRNGLSVTGGGDATVTNVRIVEEGGAGVSAEGVSPADAEDFSQVTVLEDVTVAPEEGATPSPEGTYGAVAKAGAEILVLGNICVDIEGVAKKTDCAAAWATGYAGNNPPNAQSYIDVTGNVSAESANGGAYGALATQGGTVWIGGNASAAGVGRFSEEDDGDGDIANVVAGVAASDPYSSAYVSADVIASGLYNVFGCIATRKGVVSVSGGSSASGIFVCGAAAFGDNRYTSAYVRGDTTVTALFQDIPGDDNTASRAIGGYALDYGQVELWNLTVRSDQSAWGIVSDGTNSKATAQAKITYSGGDAEHSGGAAAMNGGTARVNGYFTADSDTPVYLVGDDQITVPAVSGAYNDYTDTSSSAHIYVIRLGIISGTVTDAAGVPIPGITVWAYDECFSAVTDASGQYIIDPMPLYQTNCWATAQISADVSRTINPFTRSMAEGSTTTVDLTNTSTLFAMTSDTSLHNDKATLGLIGDRAGTSNRDVLLASVDNDRISLTSLREGSATVTVMDESSHKATIDVTVDAHGYLTIGKITKYTASSGDNGSSSGGGRIIDTPKTTVSGTTATTTVTPTVSGGAAIGTATTEQMSDALKKAQEAAGTGGKPNVTIQISGASDATSVCTTIFKSSLQALVSGGVGALAVSGPTGSVSFAAAALKTLSAASGDVTVTIAKTDSAALSDAARALIGSRPVFTLSVTSGGSAISQFGGDVTVSVPYTPAADEAPNAIVLYYIAEDGTPTAVPNGRYDAATGMVVFTTAHFSTYAVGYKKLIFTDVASGAWYLDAVTFLAARGITSGTTATTFSPDETLTRGQFITMLLLAYGASPLTNDADNFIDAGNTYYTGYLAAAKKLGITSGVGNGKFAPDQAITRQEMFTLLYNALTVLGKLPSRTSGKTLADFTDSGSIASWATDAMAALVKAGIVSGSGGKLSPESTTTRAELAQVLYNLLGK